jgi:thioesterase domain-containing protein
LLRERLGLPLEDGAPATGAPASEKPKRAPARAYRALVTIQPGAGRIPFFCVHGAGGNVLNFRDLARGMDPSQPFYGLQAYGIDGTSPPHQSVEEMAQAYLEEVRDVQPHGPYLLGGYSGGGVVAFDMAQRLTAEGEDVPLLAFIDTFHPQMAVTRATMGSRLSRLREEGVRYVVEGVKRQVEERRIERDLRTIAQLRARGQTIPFALRDLHLTRNFEAAGARYRPQTWMGRALLFRAEQLAFIYSGNGPCYGWDRHILGGVDVVPVPGGHDTLLLGANSKVLLAVLNAALGSAQSALEPKSRATPAPESAVRHMAPPPSSAVAR